MNLFNFFNKKSSAPTARERLQILLAHERASVGPSDLVTLLREEILAAVAKHVQVDRDKVGTTVFPWVAAGGAPGRVAVAFYGTESDGDPNTNEFDAAWDVYVNQSLNALDASRTFSQVRSRKEISSRGCAGSSHTFMTGPRSPCCA